MTPLLPRRLSKPPLKDAGLRLEAGRSEDAPCRHCAWLGARAGATIPSPHPSGFRPRIVVRGMLLIAGMTNERLLEQSIPDRSPGHAFIAIAHPGWRRHTKL